jgi:hypothetical protein
MSNEVQNSVRDRISSFFAYFRNLVSVAEELFGDKPTHYEHTAVLVLYCCYLDGLAFCRYGGELPNSARERFKRFVLDYSDEPVWLNISLPEVRNFLRDMRSKEETASKVKWGRYAIRIYKRLEDNALLTPLRDILDGLIDSGKTFSYSCEDDLAKDELVQMIKSQLIKRGEEPEKFLIEWENLFEEFSYVSILWWGYRCSLVHRAEALRGTSRNGRTGRSLEQRPYYVPLTTPGYANELRFHIPPEFIATTLDNCLDNYEAEYQKELRSPVWWENPQH